MISRLMNPYNHRRYPSGYFRADIVRDLLLLVSVEIPLPVVAGWPEVRREIAGDWALRVHMKASDNNTVRVPAKPDFIPSESAMEL